MYATVSTFTFIRLSFCSIVTHIDLQDRDFLTALANHAQALAKIIVKRPHAGHHLAEDAQVITQKHPVTN